MNEKSPLGRYRLSLRGTSLIFGIAIRVATRALVIVTTLSITKPCFCVDQQTLPGCADLGDPTIVALGGTLIPGVDLAKQFPGVDLLLKDGLKDIAITSGISFEYKTFKFQLLGLKSSSDANTRAQAKLFFKKWAAFGFGVMNLQPIRYEDGTELVVLACGSGTNSINEELVRAKLVELDCTGYEKYTWNQMNFKDMKPNNVNWKFRLQEIKENPSSIYGTIPFNWPDYSKVDPDIVTLDKVRKVKFDQPDLDAYLKANAAACALVAQNEVPTDEPDSRVALPPLDKMPIQGLVCKPRLLSKTG